MGDNYHIQTSQCQGFLKFRLHGECNSENADIIALEVTRIINQKSPRAILVDVRELEGRLSIGDIFFHVRSYPIEISRYKIAIVELECNRGYGEFYELAATNLGYNIHCFYEVDEALKWLGMGGDALAS